MLFSKYLSGGAQELTLKSIIPSAYLDKPINQLTPGETQVVLQALLQALQQIAAKIAAEAPAEGKHEAAVADDDDIPKFVYDSEKTEDEKWLNFYNYVAKNYTKPYWILDDINHIDDSITIMYSPPDSNGEANPILTVTKNEFSQKWCLANQLPEKYPSTWDKFYEKCRQYDISKLPNVTRTILKDRIILKYTGENEQKCAFYKQPDNPDNCEFYYKINGDVIYRELITFEEAYLKFIYYADEIGRPVAQTE